MFWQARVKLTAWYLMISVIISLSFSAVIYQEANLELNRFVESQRTTLQRRWEMPPILIDAELIEETKRRFLLRLALLNMAIVGISGIAGYYLSGKTLRPIKEMVEEQDRFVSDASHELKTPLTAMKTNLEVAMRSKKMTVREAREALQISLDGVGRLQALSENLLTLSANAEEEREIINIAEVVNDAVVELSPIFATKNIEVNVKRCKWMIWGQRESLRRLMVLLLDNAAKYSSSGKSIDARVRQVNKWIEVKIIDQGKGMSEKEVAQAFERFYRAETARSTGGYGLGLSIAKRIVLQHGGVIELKSKLDKGTTAIIKFPYSGKIQTTDVTSR